MITADKLRVVEEYMHPAEAVSAVRQQLGQFFDQLVEGGAHPRQEGGKIQLHESIPVDTEAEIGSVEWYRDCEHERETGSIDGLALHRSPKTGAITYASISGEMPAQLSFEESICGGSRADAWDARLYFPSKHAAQETQRLVIDSWTMPYVHLALAANARNFGKSPERIAAYRELSKNLYERRDGAGIPLGAVAIEHAVIGRDRGAMWVPEAEGAKINSLMGSFVEGVRIAIDRHRRITAELAAEAAERQK